MAEYRLPDDFASTRPTGEARRLEVELLLKNARPGTVFSISFQPVRAMTGSFTDEFLAKLLVARLAGLLPTNPIVVRDLNEETAEEVDLTLARRQVMVAWIDSEHAELLGGDDLLKETFRAARHTETGRASDLANLLGTSPQNMNNRLKR